MEGQHRLQGANLKLLCLNLARRSRPPPVSSRSVAWAAAAETRWIIEAEPTRLNLSTQTVTVSAALRGLQDNDRFRLTRF